ncbi:24126_t:CDS:2 [Dentiscutata erythropus]|uniref:24126_t:CDS:1 n=1 Tax=Dentiscutata erythropus TaxID=1348616 RepID=A0A9N9I435_9GLOM|nr:24126_t:CDS:2 [Dentiscutata erythropus]
MASSPQFSSSTASSSKSSSPTALLQSSISFPQSSLISFSPMPSSNHLKMVKEELKTFKNPSTTSLRMILKYPLPRSKLVEEESEIGAKNQLESQVPKRKKRKTMPFSQLLTSEMSLKLLKDAEEDAEKKANEIKRKKEIAAQKRIEQEAKKEQAEKAKKENQLIEEKKKKKSFR